MPPHEGERVEIVDTTWQMSRDVDGGDTRQHYRPDYAVNNQDIMDTSPARIQLLILGKPMSASLSFLLSFQIINTTHEG